MFELAAAIGSWLSVPYQQTADGFVVYSVGMNLRDAGGAVGAAPTADLGPSMVQRVEVGMRVSYRPSSFPFAPVDS